METLTIFTPTYNRRHTLSRTFESLLRQSSADFRWLIIDDGSTDGTQEWVESLGKGRWADDVSYDWMGRRQHGASASSHYVLDVPHAGGVLRIDYIRKTNGGLYTGYNVAYDFIPTELCACVDSDDFMPDDAVGRILHAWRTRGNDAVCGIVGLDYDYKTGLPIGGLFPDGLKVGFLHDLHLKHLHRGDTKQVMRTALMRAVAPQVGFEGEKCFNPIYLLLQVCDRWPLLFLNECLCIVDYQTGADSMSQGIYRQYVSSPRSFAKMRLQEMCLVHNTLKDRFRSAVHYVSSCTLARDKRWLRRSPRKCLTLLAAPLGLLLSVYIRYKAKYSQTNFV